MLVDLHIGRGPARRIKLAPKLSKNSKLVLCRIPTLTLLSNAIMGIPYINTMPTILCAVKDPYFSSFSCEDGTQPGTAETGVIESVC